MPLLRPSFGGRRIVGWFLCFFASVCLLAPLAAQTHPRLLFGPEDVPALRERIQEEPWKSMYERLLADAEGVVWPSLESYEDSWRASMCAFLYILTDDEYWAQRARHYAELVLNDPGWGLNSTFGLRMYMWNKHIAQTYDFAYHSVAWQADGFRAFVSDKLKQQSDVIFSNGGTSQNTSASSNWQGIRYAAAGFGYLATDTAFDTTRLQNTFNRVRDYLNANLGTSPSSGWNFEGLGYMTFPMVTVGPFAIAYERIQGVDMRTANANLAKTWWTITAPTALYRTIGLTTVPEGSIGSHPDFTDDNNHSMGEGAYGLSFYFLPEALIPGQTWMYDRMRGTNGDQSWDNERAGVIYSILYHPGDAVAVNPMEIPAWRNLFRDTTGNGYNVFRNRYADEDDVVAVLNLRLRHTGGHWGPDALSFRINGFGGPLAVGGGRYSSNNPYHRLQNTLYPNNPGTTSPSVLTTTANVISTANTPLFEPDGSGAIVANMSVNNVGTANHMRRWFADFDPASGAEAVFVVSDTSDTGHYWQYVCIDSINTVSVSGNSFTVNAPNGSLRATVVYPASAVFSQGTLNRGSDFFFEGDRHGTARWINSFSGDGDHLVVMTVAATGEVHPEVELISGDHPTNSLVRVGNVIIGVNGNDIYRDFNQRPVVAVSVDSSTGEAPLAVFFDASASFDPDGTIALYEWDFTNDGIVDATGLTASHTYPGAGTYTARLRVTDNEGGFTDGFETVVVTGNFAPVAAFAATPETGRAPLEVAFNAAGSYDPDGVIVAYEWDFTGDGQPDAFGVTADWTFAAGIHPVTLTVVDNEGFGGTATTTIHATVNTPPVALATATPRDGSAPLNVTLNGLGSYDPDGSIVLHEWDFNNNGGIDATGGLVQHIFTQPGQYTVRLRVTDNEGATDETTLTVVAAAHPVVSTPIVRWGYGGASGQIRGGAAPAQTIGDFSGNGLQDDLRVAYPYSETLALSAPTALEVPVFGGIQAEIFQDNPTVNFSSRTFGSTASVRMQRDGKSINFHSIFFWDKAHFLNDGDTRRVAFGPGSFLRIGGITRRENVGTLRWLVREGDTFYVSELPIPDATGGAVQLNVGSTFESTVWAPFDPAVSLNFDAANADWQFVNFDNVTAVGFIADKDFHTTGRHWLEFSSFDVEGRLFDEIGPPPTAPVAPVTHLSRLLDGGVRLAWQAYPEFSYTILASPDLESWSAVETITGASGLIQRDFDATHLADGPAFWMIEIQP